MEEAEEAEEAEESSSQLSTEQILDSALDSMDEESVVVGKSILPQLFSKLKSQIVSLLSFLSTHSPLNNFKTLHRSRGGCTDNRGDPRRSSRLTGNQRLHRVTISYGGPEPHLQIMRGLIIDYFSQIFDVTS